MPRGCTNAAGHCSHECLAGDYLCCRCGAHYPHGEIGEERPCGLISPPPQCPRCPPAIIATGGILGQGHPPRPIVHGDRVVGWRCPHCGCVVGAVAQEGI